MEKLIKNPIPISFFLQALEASQTALLIINLQGEIVYLNDLGFNLLKPSITQGISGYGNCLSPYTPKLQPQESLDFQPKFWNFFSDDYLGFSMKEALQIGLCPKKVYRCILKKELEIHTSFIFEGDKENHGLLITIKDISVAVEKSYQIQRKSQLEDLGKMLHEISHEIKNPLGAIRGYASLLYRDLDHHKNLQHMALTIIDATKSLERMISQILQFAKPLHLDYKTVEMNHFLRKFIKFIKEDTCCENIQWQIHLTENHIFAPIDADLLQGALLNIVLNALQAMPEGGVITISLLKIDQQLEISISDTGMGIKESDLEQIFTPYFSTKENGSGLGLSQTQKIIHAHSGKISLRSHLQKGTCVCILLPLSRE